MRTEEKLTQAVPAHEKALRHYEEALCRFSRLVVYRQLPGESGTRYSSPIRRLFLAGVLFASAMRPVWADGPPPDPSLFVEPHARGAANRASSEGPKISVDATQVLIPVTVTDPFNRLVTGLVKENFTLFDEKKEQKLLSFSSEDAPVSIGLVFDCSGSMENKLAKSRVAVAEFLKTANPGDEFSLVQFNDRARLIQSFTMDGEEIQNRLVSAEANGATALLDGVYLAIREMRDAKNPRKALLIVSDGGDNHSRHTEFEIKSLVKEADVQIFAIGIYGPRDPRWPTPEELAGPGLLAGIAEQTGGRQYPVKKLDELPAIAAKIGVALRHEYLLGYAPQNLPHNGKYRKVEVKVMRPREPGRLRIYWRRGYYAPDEQTAVRPNNPKH